MLWVARVSQATTNWVVPPKVATATEYIRPSPPARRRMGRPSPRLVSRQATVTTPLAVSPIERATRARTLRLCSSRTNIGIAPSSTIAHEPSMSGLRPIRSDIQPPSGAITTPVTPDATGAKKPMEPGMCRVTVA